MAKHQKKMKELVNLHGYWSQEVQDFNSLLVKLKGFSYMDKINAPHIGTKNSKH